MEDVNKIFRKTYLDTNPNQRSTTYRTIQSKATSRGKSPRKTDDENKTDEGLGDHLGVCQCCDDCGKLIKFDTWSGRQDAMLECGHMFCDKCIHKVKKDNHTLVKCPVKPLKCRIPNWYNSDQPAKIQRRRTEISRKEYNNRSKLWNFEYKGRPVVVSLRRDATYGDLENSLALLLGVNLKNNRISIHLPNSYNGGDANYFMKADDSLTNGPYEKDTKLKLLRHPRIAALSLEVSEKRSHSSEPPSKESIQSPATNSDTKK